MTCFFWASLHQKKRTMTLGSEPKKTREKKQNANLDAGFSFVFVPINTGRWSNLTCAYLPSGLVGSTTNSFFFVFPKVSGGRFLWSSRHILLPQPSPSLFEGHLKPWTLRHRHQRKVAEVAYNFPRCCSWGGRREMGSWELRLCVYIYLYV